jgi:asparagine synthase (glutamine-hydrolysing)
MCGFVAVLQSEPIINIGAARRALDTIAHRGPDASGEWYEGNVFLGHRRLSIIDLATGDQPMQSLDGRYVIVFNGEIYNFMELRMELESAGVRLRTQSDTEVILEGYRHWGREVVKRLHGMFAFVVWDRLDLCAFGARDRLGIKPLCWAIHHGALIVSSTVEPFGALEFDRLDLIAVRDLMTFDYIPAPRTVFEHVHKLEPGSCFGWRFEDVSPAIERYWSPPAVERTVSVPDEFELEELLARAVKRQMISDVPIGAFLSGGIDSSLIVALMARNSNTPVRTFSVAFAEGGVDESPIAKLVAERYSTEHVVFQAEEVGSDALLELLGRLDEPFCDPAFVPTYALSELTRRHVKVALSGDGGDEVFGGYLRYRLGEAEQRPFSLSSRVQHARQVLLPWTPHATGRIYWWTRSPQERIRLAVTRYGNFRLFRRDLRQLLVSTYHEAAAIDEYFEPWERRARRYGKRFDTDVCMRADLETYLSENNLVKTDRASMLASLEARVPYLDETVLDRILPLPAQEKIVNGQFKALLMPLVLRLLPKEVWDRPKRGFHVPIGIRLAGAWRPAVEAALDWGESNLPIFDYCYLRRLHAINLEKVQIWRELWNPCVFLAWAMARSLKV